MINLFYPLLYLMIDIAIKLNFLGVIKKWKAVAGEGNNVSDPKLSFICYQSQRSDLIFFLMKKIDFFLSYLNYYLLHLSQYLSYLFCSSRNSLNYHSIYFKVHFQNKSFRIWINITLYFIYFSFSNTIKLITYNS